MIPSTSSPEVDGQVEWHTSDQRRWFRSDMECIVAEAQLAEANVCPSSRVRTWDSSISVCKDEIPAVCGGDAVAMDMLFVVVSVVTDYV